MGLLGFVGSQGGGLEKASSDHMARRSGCRLLALVGLAALLPQARIPGADGPRRFQDSGDLVQRVTVSESGCLRRKQRVTALRSAF